MQTGVFDCNNLALDTSLTESGTDDHSVKSFKLLGHVGLAEILRVYKVEHGLAVVVCSSLIKALAYALVSILKVVFAYESYVHLLSSVLSTLKETAPRTESRSLAYRHVELAQNSCIKSLRLHVDWYLIDRGQVFTLHNAVDIHITE